MLVESIDIREDVKSHIISKGITQLNPPQTMAVEAGILNGENILVSAPTASGKTLIAELAFLKTILEKKKKALYIVPLKALASEKLDEFREYEQYGMKVAMSIGDLDSSDSWLAKYDLIVVTVEKLDSLLRHAPQWINEVGLVISDEIHLLNDESRGPTLEIVLTKLKQMRMQIVGLSATVSNAEEMSEWLGAKLVKSDYRPIDLHKGVWNGKSIEYERKDGIEMFSDHPPEIMIADETVEIGKQALVFASSRRNAESIAEKTSMVIHKRLTEDETSSLKDIADSILKIPTSPTKQCKRLASCVRRGTAFHHAGLQSGQRKLVENAFKENKIKIISSTPTLAAGVNLPAYRVIIRDYRRFHPAYGSVMIPVMEYEQMSGRAGRPKYDTEGESIVITKSESESQTVWEKYIKGNPEEIISKLSVEPVLRAHVLSLITTHVRNLDQLHDFFSKTFYVHQYGDMGEIKHKLDIVLDKLEEQKFITRGTVMEPTRIGARVAQLYLDPDTAHKLLTQLPSMDDSDDLLISISNTKEIYPPRFTTSEIASLEMEAESRMLKGPDQWSLDYDDFLSAVKLLTILDDWMKEVGEDSILEERKMTPGELRSKLETADWLLYALQELAVLLGEQEKIKLIRKIRTRLKYGIKEDILALVKLKNIGRVRARNLAKNGIRTLTSLKEMPLDSLVKIVGEGTAKSIKEQLGEKEVQRSLQ